MAAPKAKAGAVRKPRKKREKEHHRWSGSHQVDLQQHDHLDH
jgi:hypothetical protein